MLESTFVNVWLGNALQRFAEPDQEPFNRKLPLAVGQVAVFGVVRNEFQRFAASAHCRHSGAARRRRAATTGVIRRHGRDRH